MLQQSRNLLHGAVNPFEHVGLDALVEKSRDEAFNLGMVSTEEKFNSIILRFLMQQNYGIVLAAQKTSC